MIEYESVYVIKIIDACKLNIWYATRRGEILEAVKVKREGVEMLKINVLSYLYVYPQDAEIIAVRRIPKYTRY